MEARFSRLEGFKRVLLLMVEIFELGRWDVLAVAVQPPVVEPVDPFKGGELDGVHTPPGTASSDETGVMHHSDRGAQYLSIRYTERLALAGAVASVGSTGDSYDNAAAESVIGLFKTERCLVRRPGGARSQPFLARGGG